MKRLSIVEKLQALIRMQSHSGEEEVVTEWIHNYLSELGIQAEVRERNSLGFIKGKDSSRAVIFNGHTDTVEAGELSLWNDPPTGDTAGVIRDGNVYGLGSSDMKASLAAFLEVAEKYVDEEPPVDIFFSFVTEEETSGDGSKRYVQYFKENHQKDYQDIICIVGEPTSFQYIEIGNRGVRSYELHIEGEACHASRALGKETNAPEIALRAMQSIEKMRDEWVSNHTHELLGAPAITMTGMNSSESSPNSVPSKVVLRWDIRSTPTLHEKVPEELNQAIGEFGEVVELRQACPCGFCPTESSLVRAVEKALPQVKQQLAKGGNDTPHFLKIGIPAATFGPGYKEMIHKVNEYAPIEDLERSVEKYSAIVSAFAELS